MQSLLRLFIKRPQLSIFLFTFFIFLGLQYKEAITNYTTRFVEFTEYMLHHGITLFPMLSAGQPYPDYIVTNTFFAYLPTWLFGHISVAALGLPYCITSALTLVFVYKLGALHDKKWGFFGVLFGLLTWQFLDGTNSLALDIYPTFATVLCFYSVYSAEIKPNHTYLIWLFLGLIFGFICRGPIGLISPAIVVGCYYLISRQWKKLILFALFAGILLAGCIALLAWAAYLQGGITFMNDVLTMEGLGRIVNDHNPVYYFYFSTGLATYLLTVPFALIVIAKKYQDFFTTNQNNDTKLLSYLSAWFIALVIFFTIPYTKKARYILPIAPAISLLAAYIFIDKEKLFLNAKKCLLKLCLILPMIGLGLIFLSVIYNYFATRPIQPNYPACIISFTILIITSFFIKKRYATHVQYDAIVMLFGVLTFVLLDGFFFNSVTYHLELAGEEHPKFLPYWFW